MTKTVYFVRFEIHEYQVKEKGVLLVPIRFYEANTCIFPEKHVVERIVFRLALHAEFKHYR